jgi:hypothetical protein
MLHIADLVASQGWSRKPGCRGAALGTKLARQTAGSSACSALYLGAAQNAISVRARSV